mmetsp:Transcript_21835/g.50375  ORF Transcript_21835/g.50375 Transcript_21835/m.50375 type:complete len:153 (-) Transcript_21835:705-1163(-)
MRSVLGRLTAVWVAIVLPINTNALAKNNPVGSFLRKLTGLNIPRFSSAPQHPPSAEKILQQLGISPPEPGTFYARPQQIPSLLLASLPVSLQNSSFLTMEFSFSRGWHNTGTLSAWEWGIFQRLSTGFDSKKRVGIHSPGSGGTISGERIMQ